MLLTSLLPSLALIGVGVEPVFEQISEYVFETCLLALLASSSIASLEMVEDILLVKVAVVIISSTAFSGIASHVIGLPLGRVREDFIGAA